MIDGQDRVPIGSNRLMRANILAHRGRRINKLAYTGYDPLFKPGHYHTI